MLNDRPSTAQNLALAALLLALTFAASLIPGNDTDGREPKPTTPHGVACKLPDARTVKTISGR